MVTNRRIRCFEGITKTLWVVSLLIISIRLLKASDSSSHSVVSTGFMDAHFEKDLDYLSEIRKSVSLDPLIIAWQTDFSKPFPRQQCQHICESGRIPLIQWNAILSNPTNARLPSQFKLKDLIDGRWDTYLTSWANEAGSIQKPIMVQFLSDFNVSSHPWSIEANQKNPVLIRQAFQKVVSVFRSNHADNVKWIWGPSCFPSTFAAWNDYEDAYPGNSFVDFIGLSGIDYDQIGGPNLPMAFDQIFSQPIRRIQSFAEDKSILISETSTLATGPHRQRWIRNMASILSGSLSQVKAVVWFCPVATTYSSLDREAFLTLQKSAVDDDARDRLFEHPFWNLKFLPFHRENQLKPQMLKIPFVNETNPKKLATALEGSPWLHLDSSFIPVIGKELGPTDNFSAKIKLGWNMSGLLIWCEVIDSSLGEGKLRPEDIWDGDNVEFCIGTPQYSDLKATLKDAFRLLVSPGGPTQLSPSFVLYRGSDGSMETETSDIKINSQFGTGDDRYRLFGIVGWHSLGIVPAMGNVVPFTIAVTDGVNGHRARQLIWTGTPHYYHDASEWGQLLLSPP